MLLAIIIIGLAIFICGLAFHKDFHNSYLDENIERRKRLIDTIDSIG